MGVTRSGGVIVGGAGASIPNGQPSTSPNIRPDMQPFKVNLDRDRFNQLLQVRGYNVVWEKSTFCPFLKGPNPKDHDINCTSCRQGFLYFDPLPTRMAVQSLSLSQQYYAYGRFDTGRAQITAFAEFKVSFWDRITLVDSRSRFSQQIKRQRGTLQDRLRYTPLQVIYLAWAINPTTLGTAVENVDFTIDPVTGYITWITTNRPGADTYYSIVYYFQPVYLVLEVPHHIRDEQIPDLNNRDKAWEFPVQVMAQLEHFVRDEGLDPSDESDTQNPFPTQSEAISQGP